MTEIQEMKRVLPPMYAASSDKFVIFISILPGCPVPEGQSIDRPRRRYRNSKEILLILEKIVIAAEKYH